MFDPWYIVSWIGAIAVGALIIAVTIRVLINLAKPTKGGSTPILKNRGTR